MSTLHELILKVSELVTLSIRCSQCNTEILLPIGRRDKDFQPPAKCPACPKAFDEHLKSSIWSFINASIDLAGRDDVSLRVKHDIQKEDGK